MKRIDPLLRHQPWRITAVFDPIERLLHRIETDGTVDAHGSQIVFSEHGRGGWYDLVEALRGLIEFHDIAAEKHGLPASTEAMTKLANKLAYDSPIFEADIAAVRQDIAACKRQALGMRISQAKAIIQVIQIQNEVTRLKLDAA